MHRILRYQKKRDFTTTHPKSNFKVVMDKSHLGDHKNMVCQNFSSYEKAMTTLSRFFKKYSEYTKIMYSQLQQAQIAPRLKRRQSIAEAHVLGSDVV